MKTTLILTASVAFLWAQPAIAQQSPTIRSVTWLVGSWQGEGIQGAPAVEVYSPAADGQLVGHFRQLNPDGSVMFYELITIAVRDGTLFYRLKHFNPDLTGWEEKTETREFALTYAGNDRWVSPALEIERQSRDRMRVTVRADDNGRSQSLVFNYRRQ